MEAQLLLHEGCRLQAYLDSLGFLTIGVGYNVDCRGWGPLEKLIGRKVTDGTITKEEALKVLRADIKAVEAEVARLWPFYQELDPVRQRVAVDMGFNLGYKAMAFKKTRAFVERRDWSNAVREMWRSKWSNQVGDGPGKRFDRCDRLAGMLLTGRDYVK